MKTNEFKIGDRVWYHPEHGPKESGIVREVGERYVFVLFDKQPIDAHAKACDPRNLKLGV